MKKYSVLIQWWIHSHNGRSCRCKTKRVEVFAFDIIEASDRAKAMKPGSEISMIAPVWPYVFLT
jgi:hypothetical protein